MPFLIKKPFLLMFDPHRTRYNDRRYFTKKGQIIQAKKVNPPFSIENDKIEAYKNYLIKNHLVDALNTVPIVDNISWSEDRSTLYPIEELPISEGVSVERSCQILGLRVFPDNPKYYQVLIVLVFPRSSPYYWIPRGYKYQIFYGNEQWNDIFYLMSGSTSILEYQGFGSLSNNNNVVQNYYISKDAILIKGLPA